MMYRSLYAATNVIHRMWSNQVEHYNNTLRHDHQGCGDTYQQVNMRAGVSDNNLPEGGSVKHHDSHLLGGGICGVILDSPEELLDQGVPGVDLQGLLLVEVVISLHVLALGVGLGLNDLLHVSSPAEPSKIDC